ncbi:flavin reductase, partial [Thermodesulfobacteriota bacterium]
MQRSAISFDNLMLKSHYVWAKQWLLLTSGDITKKSFNAMTVGWGSFGTMWGKPFAQVVVRPSRYTFEFMQAYDSFTLCGFAEPQRKALQLLGTTSGRDGDKIAEAGLTPVAASAVAAPGYAEAELVVECRKIYWDDFRPAQFLDPAIADSYPAG